MNDEKVILPIRVTVETRRQLKIHAAVNSTSINKMLNQAVEAILEHGAAAQQSKAA